MPLMPSIKHLYETYSKDVFAYLVGLTHNSSIAEDLLSDTFLGAIKALPNFKNQSDIKTWLFSIARHKWYEYLRKNKANFSFDDCAGRYIMDNDLADIVFKKQLAEKILSILENEPRRTKSIVLMRIEGYSFYEISEKFGISESSARVIDFRAKKKIKDIMVKEGLSLNSTSCGTCMDLIPLVKDGVASEDSRALVTEHVKSCQSCQEAFKNVGNGTAEIDDGKVLRKIRKRLAVMAFMAVVIGALVGIGLSDGAGVLYNVILMPAIGAISYFALGKRAVFVPLTIFVLENAWHLIKNAGWDGVFMAVVYAVLCSIGAVIGFLLKIAFGKGGSNEENS